MELLFFVNHVNNQIPETGLIFLHYLSCTNHHHVCDLRRQGKWMLRLWRAFCPGHAAGNSCEKPVTLQLRKEQIFRVKGHAACREKSNFEILVTQLQLLTHNNRKSERGTQTVTSAVSNVLVSSAERKLWESKLTNENARLTKQWLFLCVRMLTAVCLGCEHPIHIHILYYWQQFDPTWTISVGFTVPAHATSNSHSLFLLWRQQ